MKRNKIFIIFILLLLFLTCSLTYSQEKDSLTIHYNLINSFPQNADVFFNSNYIGNTPYRFIFGQSDSANGINVVLKMKGYVDQGIKINKEDLPYNKTFTLISTGKNSSLHDNIVIEKKSSLFNSQRKIVPIVLSSAFAGAGAILGFVFKSKANDNYDNYLFTGDRSKLDETKKYDLLSGISLAAFQVGFTSLIYFLLIK